METFETMSNRLSKKTERQTRRKEMKKMSKRISPKKILVALIAALMALMFVMPATADELPPDYGNLHIHKFIGGPTGGHNDGTFLNTSGWTGVVAVNGVQFDIYLVDTTGGVPEAGKVYSLDTAGANLVVAESDGTATGDTYPVTSVTSVTTAGTGVASAMNLEQGLYLVIENVAASTSIKDAVTGEKMDISSTTAPFLVYVPMTDPTGEEWMEDVHVYPKNEEFLIEKEVTGGDTVKVGETKTYTIKVSIPADIETSKLFNVTDVLDPALDINVPSVTVETKPTDKGLTQAAGDYTVSYNSGMRTLLVTFTETGRVKLSGSTHVWISYDVVVNETVLTYLDNVVGNSAIVNFTNKDGTEFTGGPGIIEIHTAAIKVIKVDGNNAPLNGSKFKIASSLANAENKRFLRMDPANQKLYDYEASNPTGSYWATLGATADYEIAPTNDARFTGLADKVGNAFQTYYIVETQAPGGYNMLTTPIRVTFTGSEIDYTYVVTVENSTGFTLPITGGMGTIIFTVAGIALLGTAVIVAITRKRKTNSKRFFQA